MATLTDLPAAHCRSGIFPCGRVTLDHTGVDRAADAVLTAFRAGTAQGATRAALVVTAASAIIKDVARYRTVRLLKLGEDADCRPEEA